MNYKIQSAQDNNLLFEKICRVIKRKNRYIKPEIAENQESMLMIRSRTSGNNSYNRKVYQENLRIFEKINRATSDLDNTAIKRHISKKRFESDNRKSIQNYLNKRLNRTTSVKQ